MRTRDVGRLISLVVLVGLTFITVVSCGSSGGDNLTDIDASASDAVAGAFTNDGNGGGESMCVPKTCAAQGFNCGKNGDGCGGTINCGTCSGNDQCGIGGFSKCGNPLVSPDGGATCTPKTCSGSNFDCGKTGDGCGASLDCGSTTCPGNEFCGGGGPNKCGGDSTTTVDGAPACTPKTCADLGYTCGLAGDGCGGQIGPCGAGTCTAPQYCGGGGPNKCGNSNTAPDGGSAATCVPKTCAELGFTCGIAGDGCGGSTPLCGTCTSPQYCGGGGSNKCGGNNGKGADGSVLCVPKTCATYGANTCGAQSDGCGGLTPDCGNCTSPQYCGAVTPGKCGGNDTVAADGGKIALCTPATCQSLGYTCGQAADGCGGTIGPCGTCTAPTVCGGGGNANTCGSNIPCTGLCQKQVVCDGGGTTTLSGIVRAGLQESAGNVSWVPSGTVPDPVPGVLVYIPTTALTPFDSDPNNPKVECSQCGADVSGSPLVTAPTDYNGQFTLTNVPVSASASDPIPIVIQLGKWRRQYSFVIPNQCTGNTLPQDLNLPSKSTEGDIPLTAISTGSYDPIECVLLKMGVAQSEFTSYSTWNAETASGTTPKVGRIHIYTGTAPGGGSNANPGSTLLPLENENVLMGTGTTGSPTNGTYMLYDQILLPCWGDAVTKTGAELSNLGYYGDHGGHFFATHYSYSWLDGNNNSNLTSIAQWDPKADQNIIPPPNGVNFTGNVSSAVPVTVPATNPGMFVKWLNYVGALANSNPAGGGGATPPGNPTVTITAGRHDVDKVLNQSVDWIDGTDPSPAPGNTSQMLLHFTFDKPIATADAGSPSQCGHGIYSDFHVVSANQSNNTTFPNECDSNAMTSQERIIEYMIWDLASCVPGPPTSTCTPKTCADYPAGTCGQQTDGCSGLTANCGTCSAPMTCGGGGTPGVCGAPDGGPCTELTCASYPTGTCGPQSDGCSGVTSNCSNCPAGQSCGGGGVSGACGAPDGGACTPLTCASYPTGTCGQQSDGCGALTPDCHPCPAGQTCGGGGVSGQCGAPPTGTCTPLTCAQQSIDCGPAGDGCGNIIASCGSCPTGQSCGGGGVSGQCGGMNDCVPETCAQQNITCGPAGDGCGNLLPGDCGTCTPPSTCGGGGISGQCGGGSACVPKTCQELKINCGPAGDGCGNLIPTCGTCAPPLTCGGAGGAGQCGASMAK
jgi:hypothetical protein